VQNCKKCGSTNTHPRGDRLECRDCGYRPLRETKQEQADQFSRKWSQNGEKAEMSAKTTQRVRNEKDLIRVCEIDTTEWAIDHWICEVYEAQRADKKKSLNFNNGVMTGTIEDQGRATVTQLYLVKAWLVRKTAEIRARSEVELIKKEAIAYAPKYKAIKRPKVKDGLLYEIMMPDLHLGRLVDADETGHEASPDLFVRKAEQAIDKLLRKASLYPVERFLFPVGNDFFNTNNTEGATAHGTIQREDPRWRRTYSLGKRMIIQAVETMTQIAPVDLMIVKGNHDEERIWYFGDTLASWFHANPNVTVDNRAIGRKPYSYGNVFLLFAHGYYEREDKADTLMNSCRELWANSRYREVHLGDKHHKREVILKTQELTNGVVVRVFRSIADPSVWEFDKGFDGSLHAAEGLLWHRETGLEAQFPAAA
jgi:DNA-directed RNA polymerase subunit RPC12/RpoP